MTDKGYLIYNIKTIIMIETLGEKCIMNKLQKTITVALTAFALTETKKVPFVAVHHLVILKIIYQK